MSSRIELLVVQLVTTLTAIMPFTLLYLLSDGLSWLMRHVFRYRTKLVLEQLRRCFPHKSEGEIEWIRKQAYRNFCDIAIESVKGLHMKEEALKKRFRLCNPELVADALLKQPGVLMTGSHMVNWEWGSLATPLQFHFPTVGVYKTLSNPLVGEYLSKKRGRFGMEQVEMAKVSRALVSYRDRPTMYCLIADQTPSDVHHAHWLHFLNRETAFLQGADKLARRTGYPVFYYDTRRVRRGYYEVTFSLLTDKGQALEEGELTRLYARKLESLIRERPADWLWTHRRWKRERPEGVEMI